MESYRFQIEVTYGDGSTGRTGFGTYREARDFVDYRKESPDVSACKITDTFNGKVRHDWKRKVSK